MSASFAIVGSGPSGMYAADALLKEVPVDPTEPLGEQEKVQEVARLLSGINISSHSLASAQEMVERSREAGV